MHGNNEFMEVESLLLRTRTRLALAWLTLGLQENRPQTRGIEFTSPLPLEWGVEELFLRQVLRQQSEVVARGRRQQQRPQRLVEGEPAVALAFADDERIVKI